MAKSKKRKSAKSPSSAFYEAIPMAATPPIGLPGLQDELAQGASALGRSWRHLVVVAGGWSAKRWRFRNPVSHWAAVRHAGQVALAQTLYVSRSAASWLRPHVANATTSALAGIARTGSATASYGPAIAADLRSALGTARKIATSRRARLSLFALAGIGVVVGGIFAALIATATMNSYASDISSPAALLAKKKTGTTILDRNGKVLFEGYGAQAVQETKLGDLPQNLKDATLAAEDPEFYNHPGFSWQGTARAAWVDLTHMGHVEGGSTLTQQLIKNALLTSDKNLERKYKELLLSMQVEQRYSKDQILEMYLNEIYYGQGSSGVEAASQTYFHKSARNLSLGEAALIAGLPLGPSRFDPNVDREAATGRRDYVLGRMAELGKITKAQADSAKTQPIVLATDAAAPDTSAMAVYAKKVKIEAPHFVFYVLDQLRSQYGEATVEQGGITVKTSLDLDQQKIAEQAVSRHIDELSEHNVTNGGLIALKPATGEILAMVGSRDYNAPGFGNVNVTLSQLQPGSSFKPIAYATAFAKGWNGATHVDDTPLSVPNGDGSVYTPQNYDLKFHGSVSLRYALDNSLNIPAIKVLQYAGISETIKTAHDLGITSLNDPSRYGLSLVLGGAEVRPIDMATVYATFANNGTKILPKAILKVSDRLGNDITKPVATSPERVLDPRVAYMVTNILSDDSSRQPEFPANGPLHLSRPAAAKTGTTNDFRDNWTVGYTPGLATAVWVGNNDHSAMNNVDGITGAAPIWHDFMEGALAGEPVQNFTVPTGITTAKVCGDGGLVNPGSDGKDEVFMSDNLPTARCNLPAFFNFNFNPGNTTPSPDAKPTPTTQTPPIIDRTVIKRIFKSPRVSPVSL